MAPKNTAPPPSNSSNDEFKGIFITVFLLMLLWVSIGLFGFLAPWVYAPITYLPMKLGYWLGSSFNSPFLGSIGVSLGLLPWVGLFLIFEYLWQNRRDYGSASVNPERSYGLRIGATFICLYAIITPIFAWDVLSHPLFSHIHTVCKPNNLSSMLSSCQSNFKDTLFSSKLEIAKSFFGINIIFIVPILSEVVSNFLRVSNHPDHLRKKSLSPEDLIGVLSEEYAHLKFFKKFNPNLFGFKTGPFAVLLQSREFALKHNLITGFTLRQDKVDTLRTISAKQGANNDEIASTQFVQNDYTPLIDAEKFELLCLKQLGRPWEGLDKLSAGEVIVLAIAAPQCCATEEKMLEEEANKILKGTERKIDEIWSWLAEQTSEVLIDSPNNKGAKEKFLSTPNLSTFPKFKDYTNELRAYLKHPVMQKIISKHAYNNTIIYETILTAKQVGVLQPSSFRWLKLYPEYRSLYALVQNVGRPSVFAENMASVSHYHQEKKQRCKLYKPHFQNAYTGFCERLNTFLYTDEHKQALQEGRLSFSVEYREVTWIEAAQGDITMIND